MKKETQEKRIYSHAELEGGYNNSLKLFANAVAIVAFHIERLKKEESELHKGLITQLENGYRILKQDFEFYTTPKGREAFVNRMNKYNTNHRPGMGLGRGFGEIDYQNSAIQREIMDAIWAIEDYFNAM